MRRPRPSDRGGRAARPDPAALLAQTTFFAGLSASSRFALAQVCGLRTVSRGDVLFREGETAVGVWVCHSGRVRLARRGPDGRERVLKIVRPGETFAEAVLFEMPAYPATATVLEAGVMFVVPTPAVRTLLRNEVFRDDFLAMMSRKLRHLAERAAAAPVTDLAARFERFLDEQFGSVQRIETRLTRRDVAAALGVAPETLSRLLRELRAAGRVRWSGRVIERGFRTAGGVGAGR